MDWWSKYYASLQELHGQVGGAGPRRNGGAKEGGVSSSRPLSAPELLVAAISSPLSHYFSSWTLVLLPPSALLSNKIERGPSMVHIFNPCIPAL